MQFIKAFFLALSAIGLGGCGMGSVGDRAASLLGTSGSGGAAEMAQGWSILDVRVAAPRSLSVSEENIYYPRADIVWREDPVGNRYDQVAGILDDGLSRGLTHLEGPRPVYFDVTVQRFHSLTPKARASTGGVHRIVFDLTVRDATTGAVLYQDPRVALNIRAFGGNRAMEAERQGLTQKLRIKAYLAHEMQLRFGGGTGELPPFLVEGSPAKQLEEVAELAG